MTNNISGRLSLFIFVLLTIFIAGPASAQEVDDCLACHDDPDLTKERRGREVSLFVNLDSFHKSVHGDQDCIDCHQDLTDVDFPHEDSLEPVDCSMCHDDVAETYMASLHGELVAKGEDLAPKCWDCHGAHDIVGPDQPGSAVTKFNIPVMCGRCHKEGSAVTRAYDIPEDSVLSNYSQSIHGVGLFQRGLTVTAVCVDCHTAHNVRDHTDPESSIHRGNVANTCQQCHGQIEKVHRKVIRGELWEKQPEQVPVCVDCHSPHKIRRVFYEEGMADRECMECHQQPDLSITRDGEVHSLYVDSIETHSSIHRNTSCAQCHTGATPGLDRPCATVATSVDCSNCHPEIVDIYKTGMHGTLADRGDEDAPSCTDCHGIHDIREKLDKLSPTFPTNVPELCGKCHREGNQAAVRYYNGAEHPDHIVENYRMSIHGKGLLQSGLIVTAMCTDCHTAHHVLPHDDPESSIHHDKIAETCANCHHGIYEQFTSSVHSPTVTDTDKPLPNCKDCHQSHTISRADKVDFRLTLRDQCGGCHEEVTESYFETFHGKVSKLGYSAAAQCYDCHGAHNILPPDNPKSTLARQHIVETCGKCHSGSHRQFAGYLTHATHHDRDKYPILFYTFWFMTCLLIGTLVIALTHTLLWLPRSFQAMRQHKKMREDMRGQLQYRRFKPLHSRLHILVVISFLGLALTGMTLKFSYLGWAQWISALLGGFESAGFIHRLCAVITFFYFGVHVFDLIWVNRHKKVSLKAMLRSPYSMLPNWTDAKEVYHTLKWFIGMGPRPAYGRWTYWEKFDYFAVFWGVAIIGSTGLMLWFPEFFTHLFPGWFINVATIIHSDEALLAVAFIFTVHFFNTHFRPDKFPMDTVIFTGRMPLEELRLERPREYDHLVKTHQLRKHLIEPLPPAMERTARVFGAIALTIGITIILLIVYAEVFGYR
ncbi:MAG: cytochrome c3 family protein [candidate division Zixibacteria bacterium]|nr:cytochrome c3 family protein [candidate division Zixibacteria bacterium]MDH3936184.1 cytochrome c3 family protein [candidate division Zixibacteria bacterium]MDH4032972.1 cytochrome c3 family protein [candidate division Zixibacteria bacterium]